MNKRAGQIKGIQAALASALLLGLAPVFGKQAITHGFSPLAVVALRTSMAAGLLLLIVAIFRRQYLIYLSRRVIGVYAGRHLKWIGIPILLFCPGAPVCERGTIALFPLSSLPGHLAGY